MRRLREVLRQKLTELWKNESWIWNQDNTPFHTSKLVRELLTKNKTAIMPQPPYSPDLHPRCFFRLPKKEDTDERKEFCYN